MNPRLAVTAVIAFVAVLIFVVYLLERRRGVRRRELSDARAALRDAELVIAKVGRIAAQGYGSDPTAELIMLEIEKHQQESEKREWR